MRYQIAAVARMSNLSIDTIRSWERRHAIVKPQRDGGGARLYSDDDVARLTLAATATQLGHPIRRIAQMSNEQIEQLLSHDRRTEQALHGGVVERVMAALCDHDAGLVEQLLASAALLIPTRELVLNVLAPLLRDIGERWAHGRVKLWQEHLLSTLIRKTAEALSRPASAGAPLIFATPPFEMHEFGIMLAAMLAAAQGYVTYNLGTGVPSEEIASAARRLKAAVVVVGLTRGSTSIDAALEFTVALDAALVPAINLWLGGTLGAEVAPLADSPRVRAVASLEEFDRLCRAGALESSPRRRTATHSNETSVREA